MSDEPDVAPSEPTTAAIEIPTVKPFNEVGLLDFTARVSAARVVPGGAHTQTAHALAAAIVVRDMADARYRHWRAIETATLRVAEPKHSEVRLKESIDARPEFLLWKQARADAAAWVTFYGALLGHQPAVPE